MPLVASGFTTKEAWYRVQSLRVGITSGGAYNHDPGLIENIVGYYLMPDKIAAFFGQKYRKLENRVKSYDFLRNFIQNNHDWSGGKAPNSDRLVDSLRRELKSFSKEDFAFLLCHTGYIPEEYSHDSSEETIYTKLVEVLVGEWATRIGFDKTDLPKQKSSYEDVTIRDDKYVIVADAKSFRLGRSQKAPNVKDALKEGDIPKWLKNYENSSLQQLGGLVTFPSQHDWSDGSDFYLYLTNRNLPIICLFYEHMAFMTIREITKDSIIRTYLAYGDVFPEQLKKSQKNRTGYWSGVEKHMFSEIADHWQAFQEIAASIVAEKIFHTMEEIQAHIDQIHKYVKSQIPESATREELLEMLVDARAERESFTFIRQLACIRAFRSYRDTYFPEAEIEPLPEK